MSDTSQTIGVDVVSAVSVRVRDQEEAVRFYTEKLGFEKRMDADMGGGMRWITVAPSGSQTDITFALDNALREDAIRMGIRTGIIFQTHNLQGTFAAWKERGVQFLQEPQQLPWGAWAEFADQDGNIFGLYATSL